MSKNVCIILLTFAGDTKCPPHYVKSGVFCLHFIEPARNRTSQQNACRGLSGNLVKIESSEKQEAIHDKSGNCDKLSLTVKK